MSITFDAASNATDTTSWSHTVTSSGDNRILVVGINAEGADSGITVTYGGDSMTKLWESANVDIIGYVFYLVGPSTGANTIALTGGTAKVGGAVSFTGVDPNNPLGTEVKETEDIQEHGGHEQLITVQSAAGEVVIDMIALERTGSVPSSTVGAGQTLRVGEGHDDAAGTDHGLGMSTEGGAGSVDMSWDLGTHSGIAHLAVPLRQASAGRARLIQYLHNAFASAEMGRTVITDAESGDDISIAQLDADNWIRTDGPYLPTTFRYADLVEDPAVSYLESVSSDGRIEAVQESALESLFRRLGGRSV